MSEEEYIWLQNFKKVNSYILSKEEADKIADIWNRLFHTRKYYRPCTCNPKAWQDMVNDLNEIYKTYED